MPSPESQLLSTHKPTGYLPSLDGWRALAIAGVFLVHDFAYRLGPINTLRFRDYGHYGVHLFFAISGFLICTRILEEESLTGRFHLKSFYIRRIFRIQPAALLFLLVAALVPLAGLRHEPWSYWIAALLFYRNYLPTNAWPPVYFSTGHFWSLAVEEHFYILLSLFLYLVQRRRLLWMGSLVLMTTAFMILEPAMLSFRLPDATFHTGWNLHYLLWPAFLAILLREPAWRRFAQRTLQPWRVFGATLAAVLLFHSVSAFVLYPGHGFFPEHEKLFASDLEVVLLSYPLWIISTVFHARSLTTRFLEMAPLRFIGRLSYSLYLWHVVFFLVRFRLDARHPNLQVNDLPHPIDHAPWNLLASLACALASYYLVEKPLILLGHRIAPTATPGRPELNDPPSSSSLAPTSLPS